MPEHKCGEERSLQCAGNLNSLRQEGVKELVILNTVSVPRNFIIKEETIYESYFIGGMLSDSTVNRLWINRYT